MRWTLILVVVVVVGTSVAAATPSFVVRGDTKIGAFKVRGGVLADATRAFGLPSAVRKKNASECTVTWSKIGLVISFLSLERRDPCNTGFLVLGTMTSRRWTTAAGLRIGIPATKARIRAAYQRATRHPSGWWLLTRKYCELGGNAPYPALLARVSDGRISALVLQIGVCE